MTTEVPVEKCMTDYNHVFRSDLFRDKVALITGGGSGICFTIAELFMRHGCRTVISGRKLDRLETSANTLTKTTGVKCVHVQADVRKPQDVIAAVDKCLQEFGRLDIVVNGAAGNFLCPLESMSFNAFKTVLEIDTIGTYNVSKVAYDKYMKSHGGVIINITATLHHRGQLLQAHVGVAKAGIETLTRHQAREWGPNGVRVVCLAPGPVGDTEGMNRLSMGVSTELINQMVPVRRIGTKREMGEICLFIASDMAGQITGSTIVADGGSWFADVSDGKRMEMYRQFMSKM